MAHQARRSRIIVAVAVISSVAAAVAVIGSGASAGVVAVLAAGAVGAAVTSMICRATRGRDDRPAVAERRAVRAARAAEWERARQLRRMRHTIVIRSVHNQRVPMPAAAKREALELLRRSRPSPLQQWRSDAPLTTAGPTARSD